MLLMVGIGCESPDGESPDRPETAGEDAGPIDASEPSDVAEGGGDVDDNDVGDETPVDVDLTGTWVKLVSTAVLSDTMMGGEEEAKNVSVQRVDVEQENNEVTLDVEVCSVELIEESDLADTTIPDAFADSLDPGSRTGRIDDTGLEIFWDYEVRGVEFAEGEDSETEPLPTEPDDPRVFDQDGDGNPGLTIEVDASIISGEIYVVQRGRDRFESTQVADDEIRGLVEWEDEQEILDASDDQLLLAEPSSRPHPDDEKSYFEMVRLGDDEATDCETLAAGRDDRFDIEQL